MAACVAGYGVGSQMYYAVCPDAETGPMGT